MRRSYEFIQESHIVQERQTWGYPSYEEYDHEEECQDEVSPQMIYKMVHKPSYVHHHDEDIHDDMASNGARWEESRGSCRTHRLNNGVTLKKNEHHALGAKSILRPPLASMTTPPSHRQYRQQYAAYGGLEETGWNRDDHIQYFRGGVGSTQQSMSMNNMNTGNHWKEAPRKFEDYGHSNGNNNLMEASRKFEDFGHSNGENDWMESSRKSEDYGINNRMETSRKFEDDGQSGSNNNWMEASNKKFGNYGHNARQGEDLEHLIKRLRDSGLDGQVVKQIEVIEYERRSTTYGGGLIRTHKQPYPFYYN